MKRNVSKEQIEQARKLDLLSYLERYEPHELVKVSSGVYSTRTNDSLKISNGKWFRWSRGVGGVSALDYLVKVREMSFVDAVQHLCSLTRYVPSPEHYSPKPPPKTVFALPQKSSNNDRVIAYLTGRGISLPLIHYCIGTGRLYEDRRHNCCFVGFDKNDIPRYAMLRSSDISSAFLREVEGSDKRYAFSLPKQAYSDTLFLFESAIDCLSFIDLQRMGNATWKPDNYLSLSGIYQPKKELSETPLPIALMQFLEDIPHISHIALCLDNDKAGRNAAMAICALLPKRYATELMLPDDHKDYNDTLMSKKGITGIKTRGAKSVLHHFKEEIER